MLNKIRSLKGLSRIEVISITVITVIVLIGSVLFLNYLHVCTLKGDDSLLVNTCESVALANTSGDDCVVNDCTGGSTCTHLTSVGYVGYFDHPSNTIKGTKGKGYNEYKEMEIDGVKYYGDPGTMVIQVISKDGVITMSWVEGKN